MKIRLIGDIHGKYKQYKDIAAEVGNSLQLGDFGFSYPQDLNPENHKFFGGNHEAYNIIQDMPNALGDFGEVWGMFYIRGGLSIDRKFRTAGFDWFPEEELNWQQMDECEQLYSEIKPDIVVSHECPLRVIPNFTSFTDSQIIQRFGCKLPSRTSVFLNNLYEIHQPKSWYFGHYHLDKTITEGYTEFTCLGELSYKDIEI